MDPKHLQDHIEQEEEADLPHIHHWHIAQEVIAAVVAPFQDAKTSTRVRTDSLGSIDKE